MAFLVSFSRGASVGGGAVVVVSDIQIFPHLGPVPVGEASPFAVFAHITGKISGIRGKLQTAIVEQGGQVWNTTARVPPIVVGRWKAPFLEISNLTRPVLRH